MGLMDKVKSLFTEEVEVEEELPKISKREKKVDIDLPKKEEIKVELNKEKKIADAPILTREERAKTPVYFDDTAFEDLKASDLLKRDQPKMATPKRPNMKRPIEEAYQGNLMKKETKGFKPSPIISPVYGVLDQNYRNDDIKSNILEKPTVAVKKSNKLTVDDIRSKAFGTLEEDLENTFITKDFLKEEPYQHEKSEDKTLDIFEGLNTREARNSKVDLLREDYHLSKSISDESDISREIEKQKQKIDEINEYIKNTKNMKSFGIENNTEKSEQPKDEGPILLTKTDEPPKGNVESELFDLIDSMYEKRDE